MTTQRFQLITPKDLPDYQDKADGIAFASWPEFMLNDDVANRNWHELFDIFAGYQSIQIAIHPDYQSIGLSGRMVRAMGEIGRSQGFKNLVAPVRPNQKSKYPLISMDDYIQWQTDDGLPFDAWLRVHVRVGGRIIKPCHQAMTIRGSRAEWESWTGMEFPQSGEYVIPGGLNPMGLDVENDTGVYIEPNVWMVHGL
jgi:hypothetical protein